MTDTTTKPGITTSEFWLATLTTPIIGIVVGLLHAINIQIDDATVAAMLAPALTYIVTRVWHKNVLAKAALVTPPSA